MAVVLVALTAASVVAQDPVTISRTTDYYDVAGSTIEELVESINRNSPPRLGGFDAKTDFSFTWDVDRVLERDAAGTTTCRLHDASVVIQIVVTLPRFSAVNEAPREVRRAWEDYIAALERHENNHVEDFIDIGSQIPPSLETIVASNCTSALHAANVKGSEFVARAQQRAIDYDLETDHGAKEGALFPGF